MDDRHEADPVAWLRHVADASERARFVRENGWDSPHDDDLGRQLTSLAVLAAGDDGQLLSCIRGVPKLTRAQKRQEWRSQKLFDRARARVGYARLNGDVCFSACAGEDAAQASVRSLSVSMMPKAQMRVSGDSISATDEDERPGSRKSSGAQAAVDMGVPVVEPLRAADCVQFLEPLRPKRRPPRDSLVEALGIQWYEHQKRFWPHLTNSVLRPWWYDADRQREWRERQQDGRDFIGNPFRANTGGWTRSPDLSSSEFFRLYDAAAFALDQSVMMTAHIIALWETYGVRDQIRAARLSGLFLNEAQKWALVGNPEMSRSRHRQRSGYGFTLCYIYVHEHGAGRGFHTHILCNLPPCLAAEFRIWATATLARLTGHPGDGRSLRVVAPHTKHDGARVARHWTWFRYVTKGLDPDAELQYCGQPVVGKLRDVMKLWPHRAGSSPVKCRTMCKASRNIGRAAQKASGFQSKLARGPDGWRRAYDGSEWGEGRRRRELDEAVSTLTI